MTYDERKARNREKAHRWRAKNLEHARALGRASRKRWYALHKEEAQKIHNEYHRSHRQERRARDQAKLALPNRESELAQRRALWLQRREQQNAQRRLRRQADLEAARRRDAVRRLQPGYSERAVARTAEWNRKHPEWARALARKQDSKRRAIEKQVFVEAVDPRVVFTRDKGQCGICMQPVDLNSKWHVDHIIPISKKGPHSYANVQLAHGKCNRSKGAKVA